ncbi:astacin, partial [Ancylostoma caninum]
LHYSFNRNYRCFGTIGRQLTGLNILNLEDGELVTCLAPHIVIHELMHVVGLWHEQMREDRDDYIKVHKENVKSGYESQFVKVGSNYASTYGTPYDYLSIMHYGKSVFAKPGTISMETVDPKYQDIIGTAKKPTKNDYKKICSIYNCRYCPGATGQKTTMPKPRPPPVTKPVPRPRKPATARPPSAPAPAPRPQNPGRCYDQDPYQCMQLKSSRNLNCRYDPHFRLCCATCNSIPPIAPFPLPFPYVPPPMPFPGPWFW